MGDNGLLDSRKEKEMMKRYMFVVMMVAGLLTAGFAGSVQAMLTTIGQAQYGSNSYNLIYDNASPFGSIVWLDYTNSAPSWSYQMAWAAGLGTNLTYNINPAYSVTWGGDWRLPSTLDNVLSGVS